MNNNHDNNNNDVKNNCMEHCVHGLPHWSERDLRSRTGKRNKTNNTV